MAARNTYMTIVGNAVNIKELKTSEREDRDDLKILNFSVMVSNSSFNRKTKEWEDNEPIFHNVTVFGREAERVSKLLSKGDPVVVGGYQVQSAPYTDREGNKRNGFININADFVALNISANRDITYEVKRRGNGGDGDSSNNRSNSRSSSSEERAPESKPESKSKKSYDLDDFELEDTPF